MSLIIANYEKERTAFTSLLNFKCEDRVLLLLGKSGSGKTTLLTHCLAQVPPNIPCLSIQFRGSAVSVSEIFYRSGRRLNWGRLPHFTKQVAAWQDSKVVKIDSNWLAGINNRINVALGSQNPTDREERHVALTDAWFNDIKGFDYPLLVIFDEFEKATTEVQDWISGPFLARIADTHQIRVVISGQNVPAKNNIEWGHCCKSYHLYGIIDANHWLPVVEQMERQIPFGDPITWLSGVCYALEGNPASIMKIVESLPHKNSVS